MVVVVVKYHLLMTSEPSQFAVEVVVAVTKWHLLAHYGESFLSVGVMVGLQWSLHQLMASDPLYCPLDPLLRFADDLKGLELM